MGKRILCLIMGLFLLMADTGMACAAEMDPQKGMEIEPGEMEVQASLGSGDHTRLRLDDVWKHVTGKGVNVAVMDYSGVNPYDPAIQSNVRGVYDVRTGSESWSDIYDSSNEHGTNCAKILLGVAPKVNLYIVRISHESHVITGLKWAQSKGCRVVSFSGWTYETYSRQEHDAIQELYAAASNSVLLCASGGNTGKKEYHYPASYDNTLCVGAATYSTAQNRYVVIPKGTYNDMMDVVAPGSTTSASAPVAAGTAALLFQASPSMTAGKCHAVIRNTALDLGAKGKDLSSGYGLIQPYKALTKVKNISTGNTDTSTQNKYARSLKLSKNKLELYVGKSKGLTCKRVPSNSKDKISWSSSRPSVASVDARGKVRAKEVGDAVITAKTARGVKASCKVTVYPAPVKGRISNSRNGKILHGQLLSTWKRSAKASGYILQIATDKNFTKNVKSKKITDNKILEYRFTNLEKGRGYYWRIKSYKKKGRYTYYSGYRSTSSPVYVR